MYLLYIFYRFYSNKLFAQYIVLPRPLHAPGSVWRGLPVPQFGHKVADEEQQDLSGRGPQVPRAARALHDLRHGGAAGAHPAGRVRRRRTGDLRPEQVPDSAEELRRFHRLPERVGSQRDDAFYRHCAHAAFSSREYWDKQLIFSFRV